MANHILQITHHQQTRGIPIKGKGSALKIQVTDQSTYQIFDAEGKLLANPEVKQAGSDLWVYLDRAATGQPDLILQDYLQHYPVTELSQLQRMYTTFATSSVSGASMELAPPLAPVLQSAVVLPKAATVALAAIGTVGAAAAIASAGKSGGKDDGGSKAPPADTSVRQPVVSLNPVGNINQKNATGKTTLSGSLKNIDPDVSELKVEVNINGKTQTVSVRPTDTEWRLTVDNSELAAMQGSRKISVTATAKDGANNTATSTQAEQSYQVDTQLSQPTVRIHSVPNVNAAETDKKITLSGTVDNVDTDASVKNVTVKIGDSSKTATVKGNTWTVEASNGELAGKNKITVTAVVEDNAGNSQTSAAAEKSYTVIQPDNHINKPVVTLDMVGNINQKTATGTTTLSGSLKNIDPDVSELKVEVNINGKTQTVSVRPTDTEWRLTVDNSELAAMQGSHKISVTATAKDGANNTATSAKAEQNYQVDTLLTRPAVSINDIAPVNTAAADKKTVLSGTVTQVDGDATVKSVTVKIGDSSKTAMVKGNSWTLEVSNGELAGKSKITVTAEVSDGAGNSQTSAPTEKTYTAVQVQDIRITLDQVTQDNVIRSDELSGNIQISGRVAGQNAADTVGKTVDLVINGQTHKAVVADNFTFTTAVPASVLKADTDRTIEANIGGKTYGTHTYQVEEAVEKALIRITKIDGDNVVGADRVPSLVALSGKIDTSAAPLLSKPYNRESLHSVVLEINGKKYEAAIDETDFRFKVMIPESELRAANGQAIKATINHWSTKLIPDQVTNVLKNTGNLTLLGNKITEDYYLERLQETEINELFAKLKVVLEGDHVSGSNDTYTVRSNNLPAPKSQIEGFIDGNVRTDGNTKVEIDVHGKKYNGTLKSDKTFTAEVDTADLLADTDRTVTAKLVSGSLNAQDSAAYLTHRPATNGDGQFVSEHGKINYTDLPYFIRNLEAEWDDRYGYGYLSTQEVGKGGTIRYYFADQAYLNSLPSLISDLEKSKALAGPYEKLIEAAIYELTNVKNGNPAVFSQTNQDRIANILKYIGENSKLEFQPVGSAQEADITFFIHDLIDAPGAEGYAHYGGNVHLLRDSFEDENFNYITAIHEIFHSLGMKHPHRDVDPDHPEHSDPPHTPVMDSNEDHAGVTVMSYHNEDFNKTDAMRIFDMAFLHYRHGVNPERRKGNDVYTFKAFNRHSDDGDIYIWDGGGVDTFDASGEAQGVTVNLTPGSWIHSGAKANQMVVSKHSEFTANELLAGTSGKTLSSGLIDPETGRISPNTGIFDNTFVKGQAFIGYGTQIENLIGSAHNDTLTGNNADNAIYGGAGDDVINGGKGNDWLDGGSGNDTLKGGMGDDVYIVGEAGDKVEEASGQGNDHVYSSRTDFTLSAFVENLTLLGSAKTGIGNDAANKLEGNNLDNTLDGKGGDDTLNGGGGSDMLTGGAGNDTFVFSSMLDGSIDTITDFSKGEDKIALSRAVFIAIQSETAITTHIQYDNATGKLSYDADGAGGAAAVEFAQLNGGLGTLDQNQFTLIA